MKRKLAIPLLLTIVGAIGLGYAIELWIIDSTTHYITVSPIEGYMQYSLDNGTWYNTTSCSGNTPWYAKLRINYAGAPRTVRIDWELWIPTSQWSTPLTFNTVKVLNAGWNEVYVSPTGVQSNNYNWGQLTNPISTWNYRVRARISET